MAKLLGAEDLFIPIDDIRPAETPDTIEGLRRTTKVGVGGECGDVGSCLFSLDIDPDERDDRQGYTVVAACAKYGEPCRRRAQAAAAFVTQELTGTAPAPVEPGKLRKLGGYLTTILSSLRGT